MTEIRLLYLVSHPIQYQVPLLRRIAAEPDISLRVLFERDTSQGYYDPDFGQDIRWDVPLRHGYDSKVAGPAALAAEIAHCDVVWMHGWQGRRMLYALILARLLGKPVFMRGENTDDAMPDGKGLRGLAKRLYLRWIFSQVTAFLAIGSVNRDYYRRRGVAEERIFLMPYAIDNTAFAACAAMADQVETRNRLGLPPDGPVILYAGKMMPRKHPHTLLAAWEQARWNGATPSLLFVGTGELLEQLRVQAPQGVIFAGFRNQSELPSIYALADLFVLASEAEPWGLAVNEAMACGTAVIVGTEVGCAADLVDPSCGTLVPAGDIDRLAEAMVHLLPLAAAAGTAAAAKVAHWSYEEDLAGLRAALIWLKGPSCA